MEILVVVIIAAIILVTRYVVSTVVHKGTDAIENAITRKKNQTTPPKSEDLAQRYKGGDKP